MDEIRKGIKRLIKENESKIDTMEINEKENKRN